MGKVEYKDEAFYFIALAVLCCILPPLTFYRVYTWFTAIKKKSDGTKAVTQRQKSQARWQRVFTIGWCIALPVLWWILYQVLDQVLLHPPEEFFDPFTILGLTESATKRQIRSAYRKLARTAHPDKGGSEAEFVRIQKAYNALTDETARENYAKYGHPDGPQSMSVSIGLPSFLDNEETHVYVILAYGLGFVGLPMVGALYFLCKPPKISSATRKALSRALMGSLEDADSYEEAILKAEKKLPKTKAQTLVYFSHTHEMQKMLPNPLPDHSALESLHTAVIKEGIEIGPLSPHGSDDYSRSVSELMAWCHLLRNEPSFQQVANDVGKENTKWAEAVVELQDKEGPFEACIAFLMEDLAVGLKSATFVFLVLSLMQTHRTGQICHLNEQTETAPRAARRKGGSTKKKSKKSKKPKIKADDATDSNGIKMTAKIFTKGEKNVRVDDALTATASVTISAAATPAVRNASWVVVLNSVGLGRRIPAIMEGLEFIPAQEFEEGKDISCEVDFGTFEGPDFPGWYKYMITLYCLDVTGVNKATQCAINVKEDPDKKSAKFGMMRKPVKME